MYRPYDIEELILEPNFQLFDDWDYISKDKVYYTDKEWYGEVPLNWSKILKIKFHALTFIY